MSLREDRHCGMDSSCNGAPACNDLEDQLGPIAIIGMSARLPQEADTTDGLWRLLLQAKSTMTPFPSDRFNAYAHYHPDPEHAGTTHAKGAHFLQSDPIDFDNNFFNITKNEVLTMDPKQRLLLENVFHALENAGMTLEAIDSSMTSVFVGASDQDFPIAVSQDPEHSLKYLPTGMADSILANRISWFFNLKAPSVTVDTACSSSLAAFHLACQSLLVGESELSIVSGVNALLSPDGFFMMSTHGFLSPDGQCYSFDHRANGYARGEGVGTVIIRPLEKAIRDGNTIRAVVRATGVNQDGRTPGITLPNGNAQSELINKTYARANLDAKATIFVESHGTGTATGDPIEARAIAEAFGSDSRPHDAPLYVGAMKSAVGHLEGAAGIASLIKAVMILESAVIPPNANFEKVNPKIPNARWCLNFPTEPISWPAKGARRVSINGSGFGGTNAHVILDDAFNYLQTRTLHGRHRTCAETSSLLTPNGVLHGPESPCTDTTSQGPRSRLFVLSATDDGGITRNAETLAHHLRSHKAPEEGVTDKYLCDLSYTLALKRTHLPLRAYVVASSSTDLIEKLESGLGRPNPQRALRTSRATFVFTGQGAQWPGMGRDLLIYPVFRASLVAADGFLKSIGCQWSLMYEILKDKRLSRIHHPSLAQPICTALQIALVELLLSWNLLPTRVVGHSSGEIAAAYCAGKLGREAAWKIAYFRGLVSSREETSGAMMAVGLSMEKLRPYMDKVHKQLHGDMVIACHNSSANNTVSGDEHQIEALKKLLDADSIFARKLNTTSAYHSPRMKAVSGEYLQLIGSLGNHDRLRVPHEVHMFSTVSGCAVDGAELETAEYWVSNLVSPVMFAHGLLAASSQTLKKGQRPIQSGNGGLLVDDIVEIGPHPALRSAIRETLKSTGRESGVGYSCVLDRTDPGNTPLLETIGRLHCKGYAVDVFAASSPEALTTAQMLIDLPPYQFDHSTKNYYESRHSHDSRLKAQPRHDLFGAQEEDWSAAEPRWRQTVRLSENPWLKDHVVTGICIYPAAGFLVMAIEAARSIADPSLEIQGYRVRDVAIRTALKVPESKAGVQVRLSMNAKDESSLEVSATWKKFRISSHDPTSHEWVEHCTGYIAVEYLGRIGAGTEKDEGDWTESLTTIQQRCQSLIDMKSTYEDWNKIGLSFGPSFNNISEAKLNKGHGELTGTVTVPDIAQLMPYNHVHPHVIHPCTLDSMLGLFLPAAPDCAGLPALQSAIVPTFIKEAWVAGSTSSEPGHRFRGHGKASAIASNKLEGGVKFWDGHVDELRVSMSGIIGTSLSSADSSDRPARRLCHHIEWWPDTDLLKSEKLPNATRASSGQVEKWRSTIQSLQLASMLLIMDAIEELKRGPVTSYKGHLQKYYDWMLQQAASLKEDRTTLLSLATWKEFAGDATRKEELYRQVAQLGAEGELCVRMGTNISRVLQGEVDPLQLMFGMDDLAEKVYQAITGPGDLDGLVRTYYNILGHNRTDLEVLEVGGGTGASTGGVLESLSPHDTSHRLSSIAEYTFTDISAAFFEKAQDKFRDWASIMRFKTLNVEEDPIEQDFEPGQYDVIVAGMVIHATADLRKTLKHLHSLLKPGGKLIMQEGIRSDIVAPYLIFGQLSGWWLSTEPQREWGPWISEDQWHEVLGDAGFSGVDINFRDWQDPDLHIMSTVVATATPPHVPTQERPRQVTIVTEHDGEIASGLAPDLAKTLREDFGIEDCTFTAPLELSQRDLTGCLCISLVELERSYLNNPSEDEYKNIKHLIGTCDGLLWLTGNTKTNPEYSLVAGLLRTVRWERDFEKVNLVHLSISDPLSPANHEVLQAMVDVLRCQFLGGGNAIANAEYMLQDGMIYSNRLLESTEVNDFLESRYSKPSAELCPLGEAQMERPLVLTTSAPGLLDKLEFVTDLTHAEPLQADEVEVEIRAVGLNFRDVMIAMGEMSALNFGIEGAGVVSRVGADTVHVNVGDRVIMMDASGQNRAFRTYGRTVRELVVKLPDQISFEAAAGLPAVYMTALYALYDLARLSRGETVLIHSAAGGVGQSAVTLANLVGAEIYATVSTPEKVKLLVTQYGVQEDHIFPSRDLSFAASILKKTAGRGVDVILNSLSGDFLRASWDCIAPLGRFIEIGKKDAQQNGRISLQPFLKNVTMASADLPTLFQHRPQLCVHLLEDVVRLYAENKIREAIPTRVMSYAELEPAFRLMQSGKGAGGKTVLRPQADDMVPVVPQSPPPYSFDADASYILVGGLGGIGRSIARWMARRGARHLVMISRSAATPDQSAREAMDELGAFGVNVVTVSCDISDAARLATCLQDCRDSLPPIKGCIHGGMVLRDQMFENMPYDDYRAVIRPKVQGSWNLHSLLPHDMDFFVLLSSMIGITGNRGQANYSAGGVYQDALAAHRHTLGLPATSLDLGPLWSLGYIAENRQRMDTVRHAATQLGLASVREDDVHSMLEFAITHHTRSRAGDSQPTQLTSGLTTAAEYLRQGMPHPMWLGTPLFAQLASTSAAAVVTGGKSRDTDDLQTRAKLPSADSWSAAVGLVSDALRAKLAKLLNVGTDTVDPARSVGAHGVDSLVAVELKTWLAHVLAAPDVAMLDILSSLPIESLAAKVAELSTLVPLNVKALPLNKKQGKEMQRESEKNGV